MGFIVEKLTGLIARIFLGSLYFVSIIFILQFILNTPQGYEAYQLNLMSKGLPGIFAPVSILVQLIFGIYSLIWAITYFLFMGNLPPDISPAVGQDLLLKGLQYLSLFGGFLYMAAHPQMGLSLDSFCANHKKN